MSTLPSICSVKVHKQWLRLTSKIFCIALLLVKEKEFLLSLHINVKVYRLANQGDGRIQRQVKLRSCQFHLAIRLEIYLVIQTKMQIHISSK